MQDTAAVLLDSRISLTVADHLDDPRSVNAVLYHTTTTGPMFCSVTVYIAVIISCIVTSCSESGSVKRQWESYMFRPPVKLAGAQ